MRTAEELQSFDRHLGEGECRRFGVGRRLSLIRTEARRAKGLFTRRPFSKTASTSLEVRLNLKENCFKLIEIALLITTYEEVYCCFNCNLRTFSPVLVRWLLPIFIYRKRLRLLLVLSTDYCCYTNGGMLYTTQ